MSLSLYLHIPFCRERCPYCDFYLITGTRQVEPFFHALERETASRAEELQGHTISAIHIGGGTPSLVPVAQLSRWLEQLSQYTTFAPAMELALEANPEDITHPFVSELQALGVNRLSIGVQSFSQEKLHLLGRKHSATDALRVTEIALKHIPSVSIDVMCGLPHETLDVWESDLATATMLHPQHISVYMLSIEPKTRFHWLVTHGKLPPPLEAEQALFYETAIHTIKQQGYHHYEVSNFCLPNFHSRYNLASWERKPYLGFGAAAHSFLIHQEREIRQANGESLRRYIENPENAVAFREELSINERFTEELFLTLRLNRGISAAWFQAARKHNPHVLLPEIVQQRLSAFQAQGWMYAQDDCYYLTERGFLFCDYIAEELLGG